MSPYLCVAQHISLYACAHRCSWLSKCSGLNATRHRATRRDTCISPSRDHHDSQDLSSHGKHCASADTTRNTKRDAGTCTPRCLLRNAPAGLIPAAGSSSRRGYTPTRDQNFDASLTADTVRDPSENSALTSAIDSHTYLAHSLGQYLTAYLEPGLDTYQSNHRCHNHGAGAAAYAAADREQTSSTYSVVYRQTRFVRHGWAACASTCAAIVTKVCGRVAAITGSRARLHTLPQMARPIERQAIPHIESTAVSPVVASAIPLIGFHTWPQAGCQTYPQTTASVVTDLEKRITPRALDRVGGRIGGAIAAAVQPHTELQVLSTVWGSVWTAP